MSNENKKGFDPKIESLYQSCLQFLNEFGVSPSVSRRQWSVIFSQYVRCLEEDRNLPYADNYINLDDEYSEGEEVIQFVNAIAAYYYKKIHKDGLMPYG